MAGIAPETSFDESHKDWTAGCRADGLNGQAMGEHGVVAGLRELGAREIETGGHATSAIASVDERIELVRGHPVRDAVGELIDCGKLRSRRRRGW